MDLLVRSAVLEVIGGSGTATARPRTPDARRARHLRGRRIAQAHLARYERCRAGTIARGTRHAARSAIGRDDTRARSSTTRTHAICDRRGAVGSAHRGAADDETGADRAGGVRAGDQRAPGRTTRGPRDRVVV
jgi:hypothetical protein